MIAAGLIAFAYGILASMPEVRSGAIASIIVGFQTIVLGRVLCAINRTSAPGQAMFDEGYEMGLNKGYHDGRRAARPVLVPLRDEPLDARRHFFSN